MMYAPILKTKPAEFAAIALIEDDEFLPILEFLEVQIPYNSKKNPPKTPRVPKTVKAHVDDIVNAMHDAGVGRIAIDAYPLFHAHGTVQIDGKPLPRYLADELDGKGLMWVPVIRKDVADELGLEFAAGKSHAFLRLNRPEWSSEALTSDAWKLLKTYSLRPGDVHLILDVGTVQSQDTEKLREDVITALGHLNTVQEMLETNWRSISVSAAGYPSVNPAGGTDHPVEVVRFDYLFWLALRQEAPVEVHYSDYGIDSEKFGLKFSGSVSTTLKYTTEGHWLFFRAMESENFQKLCRRLIARPEFRGEEFSWGDAYFVEKSESESPGQAWERRKAMLSHHLTEVLHQRASEWDEEERSDDYE